LNEGLLAIRGVAPDEHRLKVLEDRVLRTVFGPKRSEIVGVLRKLYTGELHNFYSSPGVIKVKEDEMGRTCSTN
jgi:hypothetical protein